MAAPLPAHATYPLQPFPEGSVQGRALCPGHAPRLFNQTFLRP